MLNPEKRGNEEALRAEEKVKHRSCLHASNLCPEMLKRRINDLEEENLAEAVSYGDIN